MGNTLDNALDYAFMEGYRPRRHMISIGYSVDNAKSLISTECLKILDIIPSERNFIIKNNVAISTSCYIENKLSISKLLCVEGLNESHFITVNKELHYLIAKANLYSSKSMF